MKPAIKFGTGTGLASGIWALCTFAIIGWLFHLLHITVPAAHIRAYGGLFSILILVTGIYLGMQAVKKNNEQLISYGLAVKTGIVISVITGIVVALFSYLYCTVINPGYQAFMVSETEKALQTAKASPAVISRQLASAKNEFSTTSQVMMALIGQIVVGSIASLVIGLFMRTKKNQSK